MKDSIYENLACNSSTFKLCFSRALSSFETFLGLSQTTTFSLGVRVQMVRSETIQALTELHYTIRVFVAVSHSDRPALYHGPIEYIAVGNSSCHYLFLRWVMRE